MLLSTKEEKPDASFNKTIERFHYEFGACLIVHKFEVRMSHRFFNDKCFKLDGRLNI